MKKSEVFEFVGLYSHCGHSYSRGIDVKSLNKDAVEKLVNLKAKIQDLKIDGIDQIEIPVIGTGSTPGKSYLKRFFVRPYLGCSQPIPEYDKLDEIHPGNYCFFDSTQVSLGSCSESDVACYVLSRVITVFPDYMVIDAGFLAISKDSPNLDFGTVLCENKDLYIRFVSK